MRGRLDEYWATFRKKYIEFWQYRYDYLPKREPFLMSELATSLDYMDWFRHHGKPYLLLASERSRQHHRRRPRQGSINPRSRGDAAEGSISLAHAHKDLIAMQPPTRLSSHTLTRSGGYSVGGYDMVAVIYGGGR
ncbi:hypothetical protein Gogos_003330 [Gossypium gossypioides]|uniref:Uncharacterized protein n=1 Tax=Gossypium gossypioides TaxID=34282 RepID=A0A7J9CM78_GOSGO|nr:hypothetical protein [Gossypium gossypioides]